MRRASALVLVAALLLGPVCPIVLANELPASFDLRDTGVVAPVRNQSPWGACWAFASLAASETSVLSERGTTYADEALSFSPRHLAWFAGTALPSAQTMSASPALSAYASQAGEGITLREMESNFYGSPFETGGFSFEAALVMASGAGPVLEQEAPYRNEEGMAVVLAEEPVGELEQGQTIDEFLAKNPGEYNAFSQVDEEGLGSGLLRVRKKVTQELIDAGALDCYATYPAFDEEGHLIGRTSSATPRYHWELPDEQRFTGAYELEEYRALPEPTGGVAGQPYRYDAAATEAIKRELMAGRGVVISVFEDNVEEDRGIAYYTNPKTWSQYTFDTSGGSTIQGSAHAVCIVGWDDGWGVDKFKSGTMEADDGSQVSCAPPGPGAWIVRNSYGAEGQAFPNAGNVGYRDEEGKHTGYFYLSYYDMSISRPASFDFDVSGHKSSYINQYDLMPAPVAHTEKGIGERFANVFTAQADEQVHALSIETELPNTHVRLELWRLGSDTTPEKGSPVASVEADLAYGGFHRLNLEEPCLVAAGERFAVVGCLTTQDSGGTVYHVPVHRDVNESAIERYGDGIDYYVTGVVNPDESFLERDGAWVDWSESIATLKGQGILEPTYDYDNFSVKAYADAYVVPGGDGDGDGTEPGDSPDDATGDSSAQQANEPASRTADGSTQARGTNGAGQKQESRSHAGSSSAGLPSTGDPAAWLSSQLAAMVVVGALVLLAGRALRQ